MSPLQYDVDLWLKENEKYFAPPICNKLMYKDGQLQTFFVGGPNSRKDYHIEEGEEFFYMLKGDMRLAVVEQGQFKDIIIKEGEIIKLGRNFGILDSEYVIVGEFSFECPSISHCPIICVRVFLLPARIPHSPQRSADTIGLVIERERLKTELDGLRFYVENTDEILFEKWFYCESLEQLGPLIKEFFASEAYKTGKPTSGSILSDKPVKQDFQRKLDSPFSLSKWLEQNKSAIDAEKKKSLFEGDYFSRIHILGEGIHTPDADIPETFLWQIEESSIVDVNEKEYKLCKNQTMLLPANNKYIIKSGAGSRILSVVMNPI